MHSVNSRNCFQQPSWWDKLKYPREDILREVEPLIPVNWHGDFSFVEEDYNVALRHRFFAIWRVDYWSEQSKLKNLLSFTKHNWFYSGN